MYKNNKSGFTLIELIVVIAIIAILATITLPRVNKYVTDARDAVYSVDANNIYTALTQFMLDTPDFKSNYKKYTTQDKFDYGNGLVYIKPEYIKPYLSDDVSITDDEMAVLTDGVIRIEYSAVNNKKDYNFEVQIGASSSNKNETKEFGVYYYEKK